jgi:hypothetical protein
MALECFDKALLRRRLELMDEQAKLKVAPSSFVEPFLGRKIDISSFLPRQARDKARKKERVFCPQEDIAALAEGAENGTF